MPGQVPFAGMTFLGFLRPLPTYCQVKVSFSIKPRPKTGRPRLYETSYPEGCPRMRIVSFRTERSEERNLVKSGYSDEPDFSLSLEMTVLVQLPGSKFHSRSNRVHKRGGSAGFPLKTCGNDNKTHF